MMNLKNSYKREDLINYLKGYLPDFELQKEELQKNRKNKYIQSVIKIGKSKNLEIVIYEINHISDNDPRISLSKEAFSILKDYATRKALVIFQNPISKNYRLSLITFQSSWKSGTKIETEFSNPRRHSFFLGPEAKVKTPTNFLINNGKIIDFEDLKKRFSIEVVNKEFYNDISEQFKKLVGGTLSKGKKITEYKPLLRLPSVPEKSQISLEFAVRLIGRVIFCWFLREKKSEKGLSLMPKELLSSEAVIKNDNYYHKILEPIFFEILNRSIQSRRQDFENKLFTSVPYLNGGLFSPQEYDYYKRNMNDLQSQYHNNLIIPNEWFKDFFEILETYNFTIDENTSFDEELSIDPEMLGRIFENLLAEINPETGESARKSTGSYYTPRVIVDYMVDESLLLYLLEQTKIDEKKLRAIISYDLDDDAENPVTDEEKQKIVNALEKVKILDPACGSGAFPIGALQKIVFVLQQIDPQGKLWREKQLAKADPEFKKDIEKRFSNKEYDFIRKLGIIRDCIYGIDIQPIATEISRLRCFLTLIVDEQIDDTAENRGIKPLPNLDFKFVTANSLIGLPKTKEDQTELFDDSKKIEQLRELRSQYFSARNEERKDIMLSFSDLQSEMINDLIKKYSYQSASKAELTRKLTDWKPFKHKATDWFDPEWMFGIKDGFDIVIANPPYGIVFDKEIKTYLEKSYSSFKRNNDIYVAFYSRGIQLIKPSGLLTYISPNTFLNGDYFTKLREELFINTHLECVTDYKNLSIFADPTVFVCVFICRRNSQKISSQSYTHRIVKGNINIYDSVVVELNQPNCKFKPNNPMLSKALAFKDCDIVDNLFFVKDIGFNYWTIGKGKKRDGDSIGDRILYNGSQLDSNDKPFLKGRNIEKYSYVKPTNYLRHNYPELLRKNDVFRYSEEFLKVSPKIIYRQTSNKIVATIDTQSLYFDKTVHMIVPKVTHKKIDLHYLLALLNSSLFNYFYNYISQETEGRTFSQVKTTYIKQLPIKIVDINTQQNFTDKVEELLSLAKPQDNTIDYESIKSLEKDINQMVYELYGLTKEEIEVVEKIAE